MRLVDIVGSVAPVLGVIIGATMAVQRRLVRHYQRSAAFGPDSAVPAPASPMPLTRWWRTRLRAAGVLRALPDGREWLDGELWTSYRRARKRRAVAIVLLLVSSLLVAAWLAATRR
jgi:hypothetical protein